MEMRQWISCDPRWGRGEVIWGGGGAKRGKLRYVRTEEFHLREKVEVLRVDKRREGSLKLFQRLVVDVVFYTRSEGHT